jgi:hypothetical protein
MDRWKNRRRMAWLSMLAGLVFPLLILVSESPTLGTIAMPFYIFVSAVVGSYMGFATIDDKNFSGNTNTPPSSNFTQPPASQPLL